MKLFALMFAVALFATYFVSTLNLQVDGLDTMRVAVECTVNGCVNTSTTK